MRALGALEMLASEMTVAELAARGERSIGEIVEFAMASNHNGRAPRRPRSRREGGVARVDTRTAAGRSDYERALLAALRATSGPVAASELRGSVGGTASQARATLNRLIEAGQVTYEGKGRWTKYSVA